MRYHNIYFFFQFRMNSNFTITHTKSLRIEKYDTNEKIFDIKFNKAPTDFFGSIAYINNVMDDILNNFRANTGPNDYIRVFISHSNMSYPISLPYVKVRDLTTEMLLSHISKV